MDHVEAKQSDMITPKTLSFWPSSAC